MICKYNCIWDKLYNASDTDVDIDNIHSKDRIENNRKIECKKMFE